MSSTTLLSNERLWRTITAKLRSARNVKAAMAYIGRAGAKLLPLHRGDHLVVDMSLATVRAGATDPREIEKLIRRGVNVFTRRHLHSKLVVADTFVIAGSANASTRSSTILDEAAILTNDAVAIRRAREFVDRLCTEPIRPAYLRECQRIYRPPALPRSAVTGAGGQRRVRHANVWIVYLRDGFIPETELRRYERGEAKAKQRLNDPSRCEDESFHWSYRPRMAEELERGDWIIRAVEHRDGRIDVLPPAGFLLLDHYIRDPESGKERYVLHVEAPKQGQTTSWIRFRTAVKRIIKADLTRRPKAVRDCDHSDALLRLWTASGRLARH